MFLKDRRTDALVRMLDLDVLFDPLAECVLGCEQAGQEEQDPQHYDKSDLLFPSGEALPRCWLDSRYRETRAA